MPTTEAGKRLDEWIGSGAHAGPDRWTLIREDIDAIEAEAVAAERARIREAVDGLRVKTKGEPQDNGWQRGYRDSRNDTVAAVLTIIDREASDHA